MRKTRKVLKLLLCFFTTGFILQTNSANAQNIYMRRVNTEKGVQAHDVYSVFQDSRQYLWFATDAGVWRFDGKQYHSFTTANGMPDNVVFSFTEDRHQRIWLRMYSNKLAYIQNDKVVVLSCSDRLASLKKEGLITSLQVGANDTVYLSYLNSSHVTKVAPPYREQDVKLIENKINTSHFIQEIPSGQLLLGKTLVQGKRTDSSFAFTLLRGNSKTILRLPGDYLESPRVTVTSNPNGTWLIGVSNILYSYKNHRLKLLMRFRNPIMDARYDRHHHLWVSVLDMGLCLYRNTDTLFKHPEIYLQGAVPNSILQDTEGSYWITTLKHGIYYMPYEDVNLLNSENGLAENVSFTYCDTSDHLTYSFAPGVLYVLRGHHIIQTVKIDLNPREKNEISHVLPWGKNMLVCLGRHSFFLDKQTYRITPLRYTANGYSNAHIRSVYGELSGNVLYCTMQSVLFEMNLLTKDVKIYPLFNGRINVIKKAGPKTLLIGAEDGLVLFDRAGQKTIALNFFPQHAGVKGIEFSKENNGFFIVMKNGIVYLTDAALTRIRKQMTSAGGHAVRATHLENGMLWMATSNGIYKLDRDLHIKNISREHGFPSTLLNNIVVYNDTVYTSSEDGLITFPKKKPFINDSPPVLYFRGITVNGTEKTSRPRYELTHNQNFIKIHFQALHYRVNSDVECRYFLHGMDNYWQTTRNNIIEYTTLPPGDYEFEMYAINNDNVKSANTIRLHFTILPPFWNRWWFICLVIVHLAAFIALAFVLRVRQIKKRESEKNELTRKIAVTEMQALRSQMNPHFIFNSINSIQHLVLINDPLKANYYLTKFSKLMRNVLEQSRMELISLETELENIQLYIAIESLRFEGKFSHTISLGERLVPAGIFVPPMIIQPFIENAIWHGLLLKEGDKTLTIDIYTEDDYLHIEIDDNGIGREEAKKYSSTGLKKESLGMKITMERLHLLEKNQNIKTCIHIRDKKTRNHLPAGTKATIQLPIIKTTYDKSSHH